MDDARTLLTRANARELLTAFKLDRMECLRPLVEFLARFPARRLSRHILWFDHIAGQHGLAAAGRYMLNEFTSTTHIEGQQHVPRHGPLLVVANHPGMVDAMAIWVALECRRDLKIIAAERDILRLIPNVRSRLLFVNPRAECRVGLVRQAAGHLRQGGALLTFPSGTIEPDPSVRPARPFLSWSSSADLLVRLVPETKVLPIVVSGVISITALQHPLAKRFSEPKEREWAAATLQVFCRYFRDTQTRVAIGQPIPAGQFPLRPALDAAMTSLLNRVPPRNSSLRGESPAYPNFSLGTGVGDRGTRRESTIEKPVAFGSFGRLAPNFHPIFSALAASTTWPSPRRSRRPRVRSDLLRR